ncbi:MAG: type II methionyl aminopeptidase [Candidatus Micrarchaeia archaeon]
MEKMKDEELETLRSVGKASYAALLKAKELALENAKLADIAAKVEEYIKAQGFGFSFPINLSSNEEAAHYTPSFGDERIFSKSAVLKIDLGAAKDGLLGDCALSVSISKENSDIIEAANLALEAAISRVKAGVEVRDIGKAINEAISSKGFIPIKNLGGHNIRKHLLHGDIFIPNYDNGDTTVLEESEVIAIEPFVTQPGKKGLVKEGDTCEIYSLAEPRSVRSTYARALLEEIVSKYPSEPFAVRWLSNVIDDKFKLYAGIKELVNASCLEPYPTLVEVSGGIIAQAEAEMIVTKDGAELLTK